MRLKLRLLLLLSGIFLIKVTVNAAPIEVSVAYPTATKQYETLILSGTIETAQNALLAPLESGLVASLVVEVGDKVEKGDPLLRLDTRLALLAERQAQANLNAAQVQLDEAERLYAETEALSKQQLAAETLRQERKSGVASAKADMLRLRAALDIQREIVQRHVLQAPFTGIVYERAVDIGEWITPATGVLSLMSLENKRLSIQVPQEYYALFTKMNSPIKVTIDGREALILNGKINRLVAVSNRQTRSFTAHLSLPDNTQILIGSSAKAEINLPGTEHDAFWLPASTIKQHPDGGASVFAVNNNRAERVLVKVMQYRGDKVLVSNAKADQAYVSSGVELLHENAELSVVKEFPRP